MTALFRASSLLLTLGCALSLAPASFGQKKIANVRSNREDDLPARIEAYLKPYAEGNNFTGVICVTRGDRMLFGRGYGEANYEFDIPNAADTRFHIASISKVFTAAAILLLEERGKLSTSDPVSKFLPDYPGGAKIRLEHLLRHTSGIPNVNNFPEYNRESRFPHSMAEVVALFKDKPLDFEPGSRTRYSNSDYNLLALVIEKVSGQSYRDFLRTSMLEPLALTATDHDGDASRIIPNAATGTEPDGLLGAKLVPYLDWSIKTGNGSLVSTGADLCKFAAALFTGKVVGPASLAKIMQSGPAFPYGWSKGELAAAPTMTASGRSPGFVSNLEYFLKDSVCVAILSNSYSSVAQVIAPDIGAIVCGQHIDQPRVAYAALDPGKMSGFIGNFKMPSDYYVPDAVLTLVDREKYLEATWSGGTVTILYPVGGDDFIDRTYWAQVRFTRDSDGKVTGFIYNLLQEFTARKVNP